MICRHNITRKNSVMKSIIKSNIHTSYTGFLNSNYQSIVK